MLVVRSASDDPNLLGLWALWTLADLELNPLTVFEAAVALHLDRGVVDEEVITTVYGNEAIALLGVEPLHGALSHYLSHAGASSGPPFIQARVVPLHPPRLPRWEVSRARSACTPVARVTSDRERHYTLLQYPQQVHSSPRNVRSRDRGTLGTIFGFAGELLLTAGVLILLYVAYVLWGTGIQTDRAQDELREQTVNAWAAPAEVQEAERQSDEADVAYDPADLELGDGYALLRIPRFGPDWEWVVVQGTELSDLARGPGHYVHSANPGELGNLAIAGHRAGHGAPFIDLDQIQAGDTVEIETPTGVWTYTIDQGPVVIEPTDVWVVEPVPGEGPDAEPTERRITLTTCHPRYGSSQRMYVSGVLTSGEEV